MSLAAVLIPASLGAKQALRLGRFGVGLLSYVLASAMVAIGWIFGTVPTATLVAAMAAFLVINLALYVVIRSGFNLRFDDPSLTQIQIVAAMSVLMYIVYHMDSGRDVALFACFIVFLFGIFRLSVRESTVLVLYTLAAYALVIDLLMHFRPEAIRDVHAEWMSWLGLAGFLPCYIIIGGQISGLRRKMRESARQLQLFADNIPAMTVSWDEDLRCRFASKVYTEFFGYDAEQIIGKHMREISGAEVFREVESHFVQVLQQRQITYNRTCRLPNGELRYLQVNLLPHIGEQGKVLGVFDVTTDITEHKLAEERIQRIAHHDSLTGLPNRLLFNDRLEQAISLARRRKRQFALLYLDLDKFKPVNDTLGHTAGDQLLKDVAGRIRQQVRESDTLARVGGDEFIIILLDIARREEAETVARKIIAALAVPFQIGSPKVSVSIGASIGIAHYPVDALSADALVKAADAAMYRAKETGASFFPVTNDAVAVTA